MHHLHLPHSYASFPPAPSLPPSLYRNFSHHVSGFQRDKSGDVLILDLFLNFSPTLASLLGMLHSLGFGDVSASWCSSILSFLISSFLPQPPNAGFLRALSSPGCFSLYLILGTLLVVLTALL